MKSYVLVLVSAATALMASGCGGVPRMEPGDTGTDSPIDTPVDGVVDGTDPDSAVDADAGDDGDPELPPADCSSNADCVPYEDGNPCNGTLVCNEYTGLCEVDPTTVVSCPPSVSVCDRRVCNPDSGVCEHVLAEAGTPGAGRSTGCHLHFGVSGAPNPFAR